MEQHANIQQHVWKHVYLVLTVRTYVRTLLTYTPWGGYISLRTLRGKQSVCNIHDVFEESGLITLGVFVLKN